jgi:hypothetical protein
MIVFAGLLSRRSLSDRGVTANRSVVLSSPALAFQPSHERSDALSDRRLTATTNS